MQKTRKVFRILRIIIRALLITAVALLSVYNIYMLIQRYAYGNGMPKVFGIATAVVVSGSMEPEIKVNDLVIVKEQDSYEVRDVVTYRDSKTGAYVTHRVVNIIRTGEGVRYITQGDANAVIDSEEGVPQSAVVGKVVKVSRGAGKFISFLQSPAGLFTVIAVGVVIWGLTDVVLILLKRKDTENENGQKED